MTNTVRTKVAKTAKSEQRFCLFVISLFLLPQLVRIRNEDLQTQNQTASAIIGTRIRLLLPQLVELHKHYTLASGRQPPHHRLVQYFERSDLPDFHPEKVKET